MECARHTHSYSKHHNEISILRRCSIGTLDEVFTVMANTVIGIRRQPLVFYNVDGCWDAVLAALDNLFAQGLVSGQPADYYSVATNIDELRALF